MSQNNLEELRKQCNPRNERLRVATMPDYHGDDRHFVCYEGDWTRIQARYAHLVYAQYHVDLWNKHLDTMTVKEPIAVTATGEVIGNANRAAAIRDEAKLFVDHEGRYCATINQADYEWLLALAERK